MANNVVTIVVACRGAGDNYDQAERRALGRLQDAAPKIINGERARDPGVEVFEIDPGDGPCAGKRVVEVTTSSAGLADPVSRDDDD